MLECLNRWQKNQVDKHINQVAGPKYIMRIFEGGSHEATIVYLSLQHKISRRHQSFHRSDLLLSFRELVSNPQGYRASQESSTSLLGFPAQQLLTVLKKLKTQLICASMRASSQTVGSISTNTHTLPTVVFLCSIIDYNSVDTDSVTGTEIDITIGHK